MRRTTTTLLLAAVLASGPALPISSAWAQQSGDEEATDAEASDAETFRELARAGGEAFTAKDYEAAEEAFRKAYAIKPVPNLLYNIGRALEKQGDFEQATDYYEKFVNEPEVELKARRDALQRLKTLREVLALREEGEEVDEQEVQQKQGEHALAEAAGEVDSEADQKKEEQVAPAPVVEEDYTMAYVFTGVGAASLIGSGVFAIMAAGQSGDFDDAATLAERRDAAETGQTYTTVADGLLASGLVFAAIGGYFFMSPAEQERPQRTRVSPSVGPDGASVTFTLDF